MAQKTKSRPEAAIDCDEWLADSCFLSPNAGGDFRSASTVVWVTLPLHIKYSSSTFEVWANTPPEKLKRSAVRNVIFMRVANFTLSLIALATFDHFCF